MNNLTMNNARQQTTALGVYSEVGMKLAEEDVPTIGVTTAMRELIEAAHQVRSTADNLRSALGITQPEVAGNSPEPSGLRDSIQYAMQIIRAANYDAQDCLKHLNS